MTEKTSKELAEEIRPFLTGKRHRVFSELEETLIEIYNHLKTSPSPVAPAPATPAPSLKSYRITVNLEETVKAENEIEAWDIALDLISGRKGMHLSDSSVKEVPLESRFRPD